MSKKTGGGNDVEKQRVRLQRAGFDKNVIDLMVQAHIEKSGGHLSIKDHILQLGRVWAEDMDVLEKPTMTELMTRTSTVLGTGTELFQSYLVHRAAPHRLCIFGSEGNADEDSVDAEGGEGSDAAAEDTRRRPADRLVRPRRRCVARRRRRHAASEAARAAVAHRC